MVTFLFINLGALRSFRHNSDIIARGIRIKRDGQESTETTVADIPSTTTLALSSTTTQNVATPPSDSMGDMNVIAIVLVTGVFAIVLLICVVLACRTKKHPEDEEDETTNNPGRSGGPLGVRVGGTVTG